MTEEDSCMQEVARLLEESAHKQVDKDYAEWCDYLASLPADFEFKLKDGFVADIELQPLRWISLGIDLLRSSRGTVAVKLMNGRQGPFRDSFLTYPVFQMGAELFLKGMWLCQFEECRQLTHHSYIDASKRKRYTEQLKDELGHDLLKSIAANQQIPKYHADAMVLRFFEIVRGVVRRSYYPLYEADKRGNHWAHSRYPKRFYKDGTQEGRADAFQSYPHQWLVVRLFEEMEKHLDQLWQLRAGLLTKPKPAGKGES